ncbi:Antibiotic biosynthesis monooxygenase [Chitinophaga sp. CF118]|uniref:antibiotic biosynthesis monooxygenase family protein n=1 Tax=Chitinophaga sp. CF118 TaxID=1884367 RepID=UPI0008DF626D|nr:antibiotic biosynthesis monooxygenase family protein [Chitinophaga sp. CF118]SFE46388.1 Antibiotic biosynthesis monooxygenase [Chitinophaga sp. CF118]
MKTISQLLLLIGLFFTSTSIAQTNKKNMNTAKNYTVEIIRYTIPQEQRSNFEKAYSDAGKFLQASPYCLGYEIIHGEEEPEHYIVTIHWTSMDDHLSKFRKSSEFGGFFNLVRQFFTNIEEMKHYNLTSVSWSKEK